VKRAEPVALLRFRAGPRIVVSFVLAAAVSGGLHALLSGPISGETLRVGAPIGIGVAVAIGAAAIARVVRGALGRKAPEEESDDAVDRA